MFKPKAALAIAILFSLAVPASAERSSFENGGDRFIAGAQINETLDATGDTFVAGRTLRLQGNVGGNLHVSGYDLRISTDTANDVYAAGATVEFRGRMGGDLTAAAFTLQTEASASTAGNARLFGNSVTLEGPVAGALMVTGRDVILNSEIKGDARILAQTLSFGPNAKVDGTLTYSTKDKMTVPERVAPAARVVFEPLTTGRMRKEWDNIGDLKPALPGFASVFFGFVVSLLFFVALGALMLTFMPKRLSRMRKSIAASPGQMFLLGVIGLSMLFGMVPITALTIVGLPFVPIALLGIVVAWILGYALGAYSVAMRIWVGMGGADDPGTLSRLLVFAGAIIVVALLNFIPFVGWVVNYTLVLLGIGAMTGALFQSLIGTTDVVLDVDMQPIKD